MVEAPTHAALPKWLPLIVVPGALLLAAGAIVALVNPAMLASQESTSTAPFTSMPDIWSRAIWRWLFCFSSR